MSLRDLDDAFDSRAQISVVDSFQRGKIIQVVEIDQIIDQNRVVERLLVEIESLKSR